MHLQHIKYLSKWNQLLLHVLYHILSMYNNKKPCHPDLTMLQNFNSCCWKWMHFLQTLLKYTFVSILTNHQSTFKNILPCWLKETQGYTKACTIHCTWSKRFWQFVQCTCLMVKLFYLPYILPIQSLNRGSCVYAFRYW